MSHSMSLAQNRALEPCTLLFQSILTTFSFPRNRKFLPLLQERPLTPYSHITTVFASGKKPWRKLIQWHQICMPRAPVKSGNLIGTGIGASGQSSYSL